MSYPPAVRRGFLQVTATVAPDDRAAAAGIYLKYRMPFLSEFPGALDKQLLIREADVQVLHTFVDAESAQAYTQSELFTRDVVGDLAPLLQGEPKVVVYESLESE